MAKTILITRPEHDITTKYLSKWSEKIIKEAKDKGYSVVDLKGDKATRNRFIGTLEKTSPKLVVLNGHGNDNLVSGHDNEPILNDSDKAIAGKILYTRACRSARKLGKNSISSGASAYLGYEEDFIFLI